MGLQQRVRTHQGAAHDKEWQTQIWAVAVIACLAELAAAVVVVAVVGEDDNEVSVATAEVLQLVTRPPKS